jgi:hypothetical protein
MNTKEEIRHRRRLKKLAEELTYKADIYGPEGRIYSFMNKWSVSEDGKLMFGEKKFNVPGDLYDGHGRDILLP